MVALLMASNDGGPQDGSRIPDIVVPAGTADLLDWLQRNGRMPRISNVEAEAILLGGLMVDNKQVADVSWLAPDAFSEPVHGRIFKAIARKVAAGQPANPVTLKSEFEGDPAIQELGGVRYLAQLTGSGASVLAVRDSAQMIDELFRRRVLFDALIDSARDCYGRWDIPSLSPIVEQVDRAINTKVAPEMGAQLVSLQRAWDEAFARYEDLEAGRTTPGVQVDGLDDWNDLLGGGMNGGDLIILAGRPGMGKTALAVTIASTCARANLPTAFFSLEMSREQLIQRQISDICFDYHDGFKYADLKKGRLSDRHKIRVREAAGAIAEWPLFYDDTAMMKVGHLVGKLRRLRDRMAQRGQTLRVAIVDYLQLLSADNDYRGNKTAEVTEISRALKIAAKDLGITIIALSQLSRAVEQRENKRPMLSDLRESGSIEQDADAVLFVYREEYYLQASEPQKNSADPKTLKAWEAWDEALRACRDRMEIIAAKVRGGATGSRKCYFFGQQQAVRGSQFFRDGGA